MGSSPTGGTYRRRRLLGEIIWSIVAALGGFGVVGGIFYYWLAERDDRQREEDARAFFDEHGYWPDDA